MGITLPLKKEWLNHAWFCHACFVSLHNMSKSWGTKAAPDNSAIPYMDEKESIVSLCKIIFVSAIQRIRSKKRPRRKSSSKVCFTLTSAACFFLPFICRMVTECSTCVRHDTIHKTVMNLTFCIQFLLTMYICYFLWFISMW